MNERVSSEISIKRLVSGEETTIVTVPITPASSRRFYLMKEDYIKLSFKLGDALEFRIGDYIEDELFGTFFITEKQLPTFNEASGCYVYDLRFDAYYMAWENKLMMLTSSASGSPVRKEVSWVLTDILATHAQAVCDNLNALGFRYDDEPFSYAIHPTATHANEALCISYDGVGIISALNAIARAFVCEWWVVGNIIHFGKCILGEDEDEMTFRLEASGGEEANMVAVTPQRNSETYANRVYFFGGSQNIPETYGKRLLFTVTEGNGTVFRDANHEITPAMFVLPNVDADIPMGSTPTYSGSSGSIIGTHKKATFTSQSYTATRAGLFTLSIERANFPFILAVYDESSIQDRKSASWEAKMYLRETKPNTTQTLTELASLGGRVSSEDSDGEGHYYPAGVVSFPKIERQLSPTLNSVYDIVVEIYSTDTSTAQSECGLDSAALESGSGGGAIVAFSTYADTTLTYNRNTYHVRFNPGIAAPTDAGYKQFQFASGSAPSGFGVGSEFTLALSDGSTEGLDVTKIPLTYWTSDYADPSALMKLGESRLHLPVTSAPHGYIDGASAEDRDDIVEKVILFDNVFPECILKITGVDGVARKDSTENSDKSKTYWNWTQYSLTAAQKNGDAFPFKSNYILPGVALQVRFLTPEEAGMTYSGSGYKLAGMTFNVNFSVVSGNPTYTLVRNEDFGAKLPNETLCPTVGDPFVLLGWNVAALGALGLVTSAESRLLEKAQEYMDALEEDQFVFRCRMFSTSMKALQYLPEAGQRIAIEYAITGTKHSRVLGYTLNLARPYNTPEYEVGETDAYSRLRQLEEQMRTGSAQASSTVTDSASAGESSSTGQDIDLSDYLTATEADQIYAKKGEAVSDWSDIQNKPTTIAGYGITDAYTKTEIDARTFFETYTNDGGLTYSVKLKAGYTGLWTTGFLSGGGISNAGGGGGSSVTWNQTYPSTGQKIAEITINGTTTDVYAPSTTNLVDTTSDQSIGGDKTFTGDVTVYGRLGVGGGAGFSDDISVDGDIDATGSVAGTTLYESGFSLSQRYMGIDDAYTKAQMDTSLAGKQPTLVSGTNIKTINSQSLLGQGNITIRTTDLFQCGYGSTGWSSIEAALEQGLIPVCYYGNALYVYSGVDVDDNYVFNAILGETLYGIQVGVNNVWSAATPTSLEGVEHTANKVTSVSASSTHTQYASAKCLYDLVGDIETLLIALL